MSDRNSLVTGPYRRIDEVDALRGFALMGILVVNITYLGSAFQGTGMTDPAFTSPLDVAARWLVTALFESKFFLLFSFLFGYSFTLQISAAQRSGAGFVPRFLRRVAGLFVFGALHAVLLFPGDILTTYALLGVVLLMLRTLRPRTALVVAGTILGIAALCYLLLGTALAAMDNIGIDRTATLEAVREATGELQGSPTDVVAQHLQELPDVAFLLGFFQAPAALAAFLTGLAAGKRQVLANAACHGAGLRSVQIIGYPIGLLGGALYAYATLVHPGTGFHIAVLGIDLLTAPLLCAAYSATLLRFFCSSGPIGHARPGAGASTARTGLVVRRTSLVTTLAPAGRLALTGYLAQSLICALLFTGYGGGLVGRVGPAGLLGCALVVFTAQLIVSRWWLCHHVYGPLEWILRAVTNLAFPPWRRPRQDRPLQLP